MRQPREIQARQLLQCNYSLGDFYPGTTIYKCGCMADGDNVAPYCPIHGDTKVMTTHDPIEALHDADTVAATPKAALDAARAEERERCAKVADEVAGAYSMWWTGQQISAAIRRLKP